jgi:hypothetical protein
MGLPERRKIKELQETTLPAREKEIEEICGVAIPYDVDWDSLADDLICMDDMGKQAVRDGLKRVRLVNVKVPADRKIAFARGVLEMHCAYAQATAGRHSDSEIRAVLENGLQIA